MYMYIYIYIYIERESGGYIYIYIYRERERASKQSCSEGGPQPPPGHPRGGAVPPDRKTPHTRASDHESELSQQILNPKP